MTHGVTATGARITRRHVLVALIAAALEATSRRALALSLADVTQTDASDAVKAALRMGATSAVDLLGRTDGFWGNDKVRIPLPEWLQHAQSTLKMMGQGEQIKALKLGVNRAAEQAVPEAESLLIDSVTSMSVSDAKGILTGGDDSVTRFFADKTRTPLTTRFLPIVSQTTNRIGLAQQYNGVAETAAKLGLISGDSVRIENYVTGKALDGLYFMIGEEERKIRQDPAGTGSAILTKVFGSLLG
jgi:hypothetical protein